MIYSATFSKPTKEAAGILGGEYIRVKIKLTSSSKKDEKPYFAEFYTKTQVFHKKFTQEEVENFIDEHAGKTFKSAVERTENQEITILANKKGKITRLVKEIKNQAENSKISERGVSPAKIQIGSVPSPKNLPEMQNQPFRTKNYLLKEGIPVPFLVRLGVMTAEGKVISSKYDKFRQINRFLEYIDDILPEVTSKISGRPVKIVDFGSGKSYLTFAVQYFLTEIKKIPCLLTGLDLKKDVIDYCNALASELNLQNISFKIGNIADYGQKDSPDIVITLHACDTATDFALDYAVKNGVTAILSVPCCQHEINAQLDQKTADSAFAPLLKYGLIKERFAALATDAIRAELLEAAGYKVQILEFIDMSHTPKNLLIRAVKKSSGEKSTAQKEADKLTSALKIGQTLKKLLE